MAGQLAALTGATGFYVYSVGFWAAVVASLFGVWQSVPAMAADCWSLLRRTPRDSCVETSAGSPTYRVALTFMALASIPFAFGPRPLAVIIAFTVLGSLFIPFLAATLLYLNNRVPFPTNVPHNRAATNIIVILVLALFVFVGGRKSPHSCVGGRETKRAPKSCNGKYFGPSLRFGSGGDLHAFPDRTLGAI